MSRIDLVTAMAASSDWTKVGADRALRAFLESVRTSLKRGQPVTLVGFGTFSVTRRKPRKGKNPRTGQPMNVAGGRTPRFKPSKELKRAVR
jgi:DNA-binding protein HU-beta